MKQLCVFLAAGLQGVAHSTPALPPAAGRSKCDRDLRLGPKGGIAICCLHLSPNARLAPKGPFPLTGNHHAADFSLAHLLKSSHKSRWSFEQILCLIDMTRDETVALFLECEAVRAAARAVALRDGKDKRDAEQVAHRAAQAHWNAWAESLLAQCKAIEADGHWAAERDRWSDKAATDFSRCLFLVRGAEGSKETAGRDKKESEDGGPPVKLI